VNTTSKQFFICAAIIAGAFGLDRATKWTADAQLPETTVQLLSPILALTRHHNFGLLADTPFPRWIVIATTSAIIAILAFWLTRTILSSSDERLPTPDSRLPTPSPLPLSLILAGALGNLWVRVTLGYVFDWILLFNRSVINVADILIAVGILWFVAGYWKKSTPAVPAASD